MTAESAAIERARLAAIAIAGETRPYEVYHCRWCSSRDQPVWHVGRQNRKGGAS